MLRKMRDLSFYNSNIAHGLQFIFKCMMCSVMIGKNKIDINALHK